MSKLKQFYQEKKWAFLLAAFVVLCLLPFVVKKALTAFWNRLRAGKTPAGAQKEGVS